ncbi:MAG: hypothetical protein OHK0046_08540 [Anaerolineae bacterium]
MESTVNALLKFMTLVGFGTLVMGIAQSDGLLISAGIMMMLGFMGMVYHQQLPADER